MGSFGSFHPHPPVRSPVVLNMRKQKSAKKYQNVKAKCIDENYRDPAKKINVYINGDDNFRARQFTIPKILEHTDEPKAMQGLCEMLTSKMKEIGRHEGRQFRDARTYRDANSEAIHHLLTPYGGTRVDSVKQLKMDKDYVACHKNKLIRIDYEQIGKAPLRPKTGRHIHTTWSRLRQDPEMYSAPIRHQLHYAQHYNHNINDEKPKYSKVKERKVIHIYGNGDPISATRILLSDRLVRHDPTAFQLVLDTISERVGRTLNSTRTASVFGARRLFTLGGKRVTSQSDIIDGQSYVMCDNRPFRRMSYGAYGLNPAWRRTIKPERTRDGRIVGFGDGNSPKVERPKSVRNPYVVLPKLKQKKVYYSEKYEQQQDRSRSRNNNTPLPPIGAE